VGKGGGGGGTGSGIKPPDASEEYKRLSRCGKGGNKPSEKIKGTKKNSMTIPTFPGDSNTKKRGGTLGGPFERND